MQVSIEGRNTEVQPRWREVIEQKLAKLERYPNEITRARVTISHNAHHQVGDNHVQIVLAVSGRTLTVKKSGARIPEVLRSALTAAGRELATYHQGRKRFVKAAAPQPIGTVSRVFRSKGYGFIHTDGEHEVYFHRGALDGLSFDELVKGQTVAFEAEEGGDGPRAVRVYGVARR